MTRDIRSSIKASRVALCLRLCLTLVSAACGSDATFAPASNPETLYWSLSLDHHAVQLSMAAPYDTIQLTATALTPSGAPWSNGSATEPVRWASLDSSKVLVSKDGLVTARAVTDGLVGIVASRQVGNVTHTDTAQVWVLGASSQRLTTFHVRPEAPDSSHMETDASRGFDVTALDADGEPMDIVTYFSVSDTTVAKFDNSWQPWITSRRVGATLVTATTWVYGVAMTDTFTLSVGYAMVAYPGVLLGFGGRLRQLGKNVVIGVNGEVGWTNETGGYNEDDDEVIEGQPFDVIFEHPEQALPSAHPENDSGGGNIMSVPSDPDDVTMSRRFRRFSQPGVYRYSIPQFGYTGTVIVRGP